MTKIGIDDLQFAYQEGTSNQICTLSVIENVDCKSFLVNPVYSIVTSSLALLSSFSTAASVTIFQLVLLQILFEFLNEYKVSKLNLRGTIMWRV